MLKVLSQFSFFNGALVLTIALLLLGNTILVSQNPSTSCALTSPRSKSDSNNFVVQINMGPAIPLLNLTSPVYQSYNLDQKFRTGFASPGFVLNLSASYFLKPDWGFAFKFADAQLPFNNASFLTNKLVSGDTITNPHGATHNLNAFLLGLVIRMPQGLASLYPRYSIQAYAVAGIMNFQYGAITYDQSTMHVSLPSLASNSMAISTGLTACYKIQKYIHLTLNLDILAGNAKFPDQTTMSYSVFTTDLGLLIYLN